MCCVDGWDMGDALLSHSPLRLYETKTGVALWVLAAEGQDAKLESSFNMMKFIDEVGNVPENRPPTPPPFEFLEGGLEGFPSYSEKED